jgi:hypothetical protein
MLKVSKHLFERKNGKCLFDRQKVFKKLKIKPHLKQQQQQQSKQQPMQQQEEQQQQQQPKQQ